MSWLEKLYKTYDNCTDHIGKANGTSAKLLPIYHTTQNAQIEIVIDGSGSFQRARVIPKSEAVTDIPCTEESGGRAGAKPTCHPLCDKLQYVAGDFVKFGGQVTSGFSKDQDEPHRIYIELLAKWCDRHPKIKAVYTYVKKSSTVADLFEAGVLPKDVATGCLLKKWEDLSVKTPEIYGVMPAKALPEEAFVRWIVEIPDDPQSLLWCDRSVWQSWIDYYASSKTSSELCYVTGEFIPLAKQHPAKLRNSADKAKLISANDGNGFTFRGRFSDSTGSQACGVGLEISHKAHNILRWLISRQGYCNGLQAIVAWSVANKSVPDPFANSLDILRTEAEPSETFPERTLASPFSNGNAAQDFALRLKRKIGGYKTELGPVADIIVLALDSATTGRMSIIYYRELTSSEFLARIEAWHEQCCWFQNYSKDVHFIGAPSPRDIAEAAYGRRVDDKLRSATIRQLLPCIIDAAPLPRHLVECCVRRAGSRNGIETWDWEKTLGIACALYCKHTKNERNYQMALETDRSSRDYLYGRLLALAERLEEVALYLTNEKRATNAERLMQRFSDNPYATWLIIAKALKPYEMRLRNQRAGFLHNIKSEMDAVMAAFKVDEFTSPTKLSGEFLLGYHCQRKAMKDKTDKINVEESIEEEIDV